MVTAFPGSGKTPGLALAGDWCVEGRGEGAFDSGLAAACALAGVEQQAGLDALVADMGGGAEAPSALAGGV